MSESMLGIYGDSGQLIIDDAFNNLQLVDKSYITLAKPKAWANGKMFREPSIVSMTNALICAVELLGNPVCAVRKAITSSTEPCCHVVVPSSVSVDKIACYLFGIRHQVGRFGVEVFDSQGNCIFNANNKYMRVVDYTEGVLNASIEQSVLTLPKSNQIRKYAIAFPATILYAQAVSGEPVMRYIGAYAYIRDGQVFVRSEVVFAHWKPISMEYGNIYPRFDCMIIDITGL